MKRYKLTKKIVTLLIIAVMLIGSTLTVFAYSSSCTVGPIAPRTTAPGHITLNPYVGTGRHLYVEIVGGLSDMDYAGRVHIAVTRVSSGKEYTYTLSKTGYKYSLPVTLPGSGDYSVTVRNDSSANVTVLVKWIA